MKFRSVFKELCTIRSGFMHQVFEYFQKLNYNDCMSIAIAMFISELFNNFIMDILPLSIYIRNTTVIESFVWQYVVSISVHNVIIFRFFSCDFRSIWIAKINEMGKCFKKTGEFFPKFDYRWNLRAYWIKEEGNCTLSMGKFKYSHRFYEQFENRIN